MKRTKFNGETDNKINMELNGVERDTIVTKRHMASTSLGEDVGSTSTVTLEAKAENKEESKPEISAQDQLPNELHGMRIRDDNSTKLDEKVDFVFLFICGLFFLKQIYSAFLR